ncbi:MAG TPA: hypothetical protein VGL53_12795 [Bryobacteraceae bacterium]|jgi:hypothetical protein
MFSRREWIAGTAFAAAAAGQTKASSSTLAERFDANVAHLIDAQNLDTGARHRGGLVDSTGLYMPGSIAGLIEQFSAAYVWPQSKYRGNPLMVERLTLATQYLERVMTKDGNINLLSTNFNSPPDTGFLMHGLCTAAFIARKYKAKEIEDALHPVLERAGDALIKGGIHTPNHRWVVSAAMAQLNVLYPDPRLIKRIDQWLAEGIDIGPDGQFSERSTTVYSGVSDRAFTVMAAKLGRPELLDPVRRNLNSLLYLLHPGGEVATDVSHRQDRNVRGTADRYWLPIRYLAVHDNNGVFESLGRQYASNGVSVPEMLEYGELVTAAVEPKPLPEDYRRTFPALGIARVRRGPTSATLVLGGSDRFFSLRRGAVVVNAVRFATAFFGKGQFVPTLAVERDGGWYFEQNLEGPYYQPLEHPTAPIIAHEDFEASKKIRRQSEVGHLRQSAFLKETPKGFELRIAASGTDEVPLSVEISFAPEGRLEGCTALHDVWLLEKDWATMRAGDSSIRFGPGHAEHRYVQLRGALPKLDGTSVYLTGSTPFDHTITFEFS